jgi:hypothetical protein
MRRKSGSSQREIQARDCVIMTAIGRMLSAQYDLAEPLSDRLGHLLKRIENREEVAAVETRGAQIP